MSVATDILPFIPQRAPFVMVSTLERCDDEGAETSFIIEPDNIFVQNDLLNEAALIENIAQTAAARMGYICQQEQKPVPVGFIGAVQNLKISELPKTGEILTTTITIKHQIFNATIIEGRVQASGRELAQCEMKIFITE